MGTWGIKLKDDDDFSDIFEAFFEKYNKGEAVENITKELIKENIESGFEDDNENHSFWFALADAQHKCGKLEKEISQNVSKIVENRQNIEFWRELEASEKDLKTRETELEKFVERLINYEKFILHT
jgi:hypothetical protein